MIEDLTSSTVIPWLDELIFAGHADIRVFSANGKRLDPQQLRLDLKSG
jgi:hypothetical protein